MKVLLLIMATIAYVAAEADTSIEWEDFQGICLAGPFKDGCKLCNCESDNYGSKELLHNYYCSKECVDEKRLDGAISEVFRGTCEQNKKFKKDCKTCYCDKDGIRYVCTIGCSDR